MKNSPLVPPTRAPRRSRGYLLQISSVDPNSPSISCRSRDRSPVRRRLRRLSITRARSWLLALIVVVSTTLACTSPDCTNEIWQSIPSPDGELKAVTFVRSCTTIPVDVGHVSVLPLRARAHTAVGNVARVVHGEGDEGKSHGATQAVAVEWIGPRQLVVRYDSSALVQRREPPLAGLHVLFVPTAPQP